MIDTMELLKLIEEAQPYVENFGCKPGIEDGYQVVCIEHGGYLPEGSHSCGYIYPDAWERCVELTHRLAKLNKTNNNDKENS